MLSETLNALIKESGKSQRQVATDLNLGIQRFNYYVTGKREPDTNTLQSIAEYFDVSVDYLLGRDEQQKKPTVEDDGLSDRQRAFIESVRSMSPEDLDLLESLIAVVKKQNGGGDHMEAQKKTQFIAPHKRVMTVGEIESNIRRLAVEYGMSDKFEEIRDVASGRKSKLDVDFKNAADAYHFSELVALFVCAKDAGYTSILDQQNF